jgi:hypothetical protein
LSLNKERAKENQPGVPSWIPLRLPLFKMLQEIDISVLYAVLQGKHHERQAEKAKSFAGCQGVLDPLARFLATSWGGPRSSMKSWYRSAHGAAVQYDRQEDKMCEI